MVNYMLWRRCLKLELLENKSVSSVLNERNILEQLKHPLIVNMRYAFQTRSYLHLVLDLLTGGDLRYHLCKRLKFKEEQTRFFVAWIVSALEYIHGQGYLHRDIKPENLVFDEKGYLHVTDFGISKKMRPNNKTDSSGTPGYMAPEIMIRQNHGPSVDFFAIGVITYECMNQTRPYVGKTRQEIRDHILSTQVSIKQSKIPPGWSYEAADFVNQWIKRKKYERLGYRGINEVKNHPWLREFNFSDLYNKKLDPPFVPPKEDNFDSKIHTHLFKDDYSEKSLADAIGILENQVKDIDEVQELFKEYYYDYREKADFRTSNLTTIKESREIKTGTKPMTSQI